MVKNISLYGLSQTAMIRGFGFVMRARVVLLFGHLKTGIGSGQTGSRKITSSGPLNNGQSGAPTCILFIITQSHPGVGLKYQAALCHVELAEWS